MAAPDPKTPTRAQLFKFLGNHELVRLFEELFKKVGNSTPSEIEELSIAVGIADAKANSATTYHSRLKNLLWSVAGHIFDTVLQMNGNTIAGDDASGGDLTFTSTTHATKADIHFGISAPRMTYKENDNKLTLGSISFNAEDSRAEIGDPGFETSGVNVNGTTRKTGLRVNDFGNENFYQMIAHRHSTANAANLIGVRSNSDTSSHAALTAGQNCFDIEAAGWTGSQYSKVGQMTMTMDAGTISDSSSPGKICFLTTPDGSIIPIERICIRENGDIEVKSENLILPKTEGKGIKVDTTTPTFGWRDLRAEIRTRGVGATDPNDTTYAGNIKAYSFSVNDESWIEFHIPHDYVKGTDIHLHFHWSHNSALVTGGRITIGANVTYAKGHDQAAFPAEITTAVSPGASTTQYQHMVSEVQLSASPPSGLQIDTDDLEPDGLILARVYLSANNITSSGAVPDPFIHEVDVHYQSTSIPTKNKVPDFYA